MSYNPFSPEQWNELSKLAERVERLDRGVTRLLFANGLGLSIAHNDFVKRSDDTAELASLKHGEIAYGPLTGDVIPWATFNDALAAARFMAAANPAEFSDEMPSMVD
jgi:hypothetical protein